ncbi:MAG TPA: hypothetical protein VGN57_14450 [Pirellulaceae bacterium]|jgi:hypothetical protein|nr:hypothetical protein [Pirellulaceae bacterium]
MSTIDGLEQGETIFRQVLNGLREPRGDAPDWPEILFTLIDREFRTGRRERVEYLGARVLVDRDEKDPSEAEAGSEKSVTRLLYQRCRASASATLTVGEDVYWLIGYEIPCFAKKSKQCADLLGLSRSGGLVVFECKIEKNSYAPITSAIEGLDYLTCLTAQPNFDRLCKEFEEWRAKPEQIASPEFARVVPRSDARHEVVVLGPKTYYDKFLPSVPGESRRTLRGSGWEHFARLCQTRSGELRIGFAETDFGGTSAGWFDFA